MDLQIVQLINDNFYYLYIILGVFIIFFILNFVRKIEFKRGNTGKFVNELNNIEIVFPAICFYDGDNYSYFDTYEELNDDLDGEDEEYINSFYLIDSSFKKYKARLINEDDYEIYNSNEIINFDELKKLIVNLDGKDILESKDFNELIGNI